MDEGNEDTISAFEETDAAVDLRVKNSLCLVIDLEWLFVQKKFQVREMGHYSWNEHFDRRAFYQPAALKDLSHKDKKTVNFAKHNIQTHLSTPLPMTGSDRKKNKRPCHHTPKRGWPGHLATKHNRLWHRI